MDHSQLSTRTHVYYIVNVYTVLHWRNHDDWQTCSQFAAASGSFLPSMHGRVSRTVCMIKLRWFLFSLDTLFTYTINKRRRTIKLNTWITIYYRTKYGEIYTIFHHHIFLTTICVLVAKNGEGDNTVWNGVDGVPLSSSIHTCHLFPNALTFLPFNSLREIIIYPTKRTTTTRVECRVWGVVAITLSKPQFFYILWSQIGIYFLESDWAMCLYTVYMP